MDRPLKIDIMTSLGSDVRMTSAIARGRDFYADCADFGHENPQVNFDLT